MFVDHMAIHFVVKAHFITVLREICFVSLDLEMGL